MPGSISIGAFVFGAILVLLALAGGGFKLFGAEVPKASGPISRALAGVLGLVLIVLGVAREERRDAAPAPAETTPSGPSASERENTAAESSEDRSGAPTVNSGVVPPALELGTYDPEPDERTPNAPSANARDEVVRALRGAVDAATEAVNEQDGSVLDAHFEGSARAEVNPLSSLVPVMLQQGGLDYNTFQSMGYRIVSAFEIASVDNVDVAAGGDRAEVAVHLLFRVRTQGQGECVEGRQGPSAVTYSLRRAGSGWRVYAIRGQTTMQPVEGPC